jgi:hypothetical protein
MLIRIAHGTATLEAPEDLKRFKLVVTGGAEGAALQQALGTAGRLEGEHVWVSPTWLAQASGRGADAAWLEAFGGMVGFAAKQGWVNEAGEIRAHIERE